MSAITALLIVGAGLAYLLVCVAVGSLIGRAAKLGEDVPHAGDLIELEDVRWDWPRKGEDVA